MKALIDGDIVCYRCAAVCEASDVNIAKWQTDELLDRIVKEVEADDFKVYINGEDNFRYKLYPDYKANRRDMVKPRHLEALRGHLIKEWDASVVNGMETDDQLGIDQDKGEPDIPPEVFQTVICSIDKDLLQVPGNHFNFVKREWTVVSPFDGWRNFYSQLLIGDATDNISGCPGIGKAKAPKVLEYAETPLEMWNACYKMYLAAYEKNKLDLNKVDEDINLNAALLYILREEGDKWNPPLPKAEAE